MVNLIGRTVVDPDEVLAGGFARLPPREERPGPAHPSARCARLAVSLPPGQRP